MALLDKTRLMKILGLPRKVGKPTQEGQVGSDQTGLIIGSSTDGSRKVGEADTGKVVFYNTATGDDGTGAGTSGNPYLTYARAAQDIDGSTKTWVEQQDSANLDLSGEPLIVNVQAALTTISEITGIPDESTIAFTEVDSYAAEAHATGYGNNVFLMTTGIASGGVSFTIKRSTDEGATWGDVVVLYTGANPPASGSSLTFHDGVWIMTSGKEIFRSTDDGLTWAIQTHGFTPAGLSMSNSFAGDGVFYAIGIDSSGSPIAKIETSPDGITWTDRALPTTPTTETDALVHGAYGNGVAIAIALNQTGLDGNTSGFRSTDGGVTWTAIDWADLNFTDSLGDPDTRGLAFHNGKFMIVGPNNGGNIENVTSTDGVTWALQAGTFAAFTIEGLEAGAGVFIAHGTDNLQKSEDGVSWAAITFSFPASSIVRRRGLAYGTKTFAMNVRAGSGTVGRIAQSDDLGVLGVAGFDINLASYIHGGDQIQCSFDSQTVWAGIGSIINCAMTDADVITDGDQIESTYDSASTLNGSNLLSATWTNSEFLGPVRLSGSIDIDTCDFTPAAGKALVVGSTVTIDQTLIESEDDNALEATTNNIQISNSIIRCNTTGFIPLTIVGFAAVVKDIFIEFCTIKAVSLAEDTAVSLDNDGGTGLEQMHNNIVEGGIVATELVTPMLIESGAVRGSIIGALPKPGKVFSTDPLFLSDADLRLQRESGYSDTALADFDSPLVKSAILGDNGSISILTVTSGQVRDMGAFNFDDSAVSEEFTLALDIPKAEGITITPINRSSIHLAVSGVYDQYNDIDRRGERLKTSYRQSTTREVIAFFEEIERRDRTGRVSIALDLNDTFPLPSIIADGVHTIGTVIVNIDPADIWLNSYVIIGGEDYGISFALNADNNKAVREVTQLILMRPIEVAIADDESLAMEFPQGDGEFIYEVDKNPGYTRVESVEANGNVMNFSMTFSKKK